jgi:hypothetical protein
MTMAYSRCAIIIGISPLTLAATHSVTGYLPFTLNPGQIIKHRIPLDLFPTVEAAVTAFESDVVYGVGNDTRVPLSQVVRQ